MYFVSTISTLLCRNVENPSTKKMFYITVKRMLYITMCAYLPKIICSMEEHLCKILGQILFACWLAKLLFEPTTSSGILLSSCSDCEQSITLIICMTALVYMMW